MELLLTWINRVDALLREALSAREKEGPRDGSLVGTLDPGLLDKHVDATLEEILVAIEYIVGEHYIWPSSRFTPEKPSNLGKVHRAIETVWDACQDLEHAIQEFDGSSGHGSTSPSPTGPTALDEAARVEGERDVERAVGKATSATQSSALALPVEVFRWFRRLKSQFPGAQLDGWPLPDAAPPLRQLVDESYLKNTYERTKAAQGKKTKGKRSGPAFPDEAGLITQLLLSAGRVGFLGTKPMTHDLEIHGPQQPPFCIHCGSSPFSDHEGLPDKRTHEVVEDLVQRVLEIKVDGKDWLKELLKKFRRRHKQSDLLKYGPPYFRHVFLTVHRQPRY